MKTAIVPLVLGFALFPSTSSTGNQSVKNGTSHAVAATQTSLAKVNVTDISSNELSGGFMSFLDNEELMAAGRESLRVFVKALKTNRSIDEALTIAVTAYATTRTAREIKGNLKNAKLSLDRDFGETTLFSVALHLD